jgi:hypothetical protein
MIGGIDYIFTAPLPSHGTLQEAALRFFRARWPECVVESDDASAPVSAADAEATATLLRSDELFFYTSPDAAKSWDEKGADTENTNQMVYAIFSPENDSQECSVTAVIDEMTPEMEDLLEDFKEALRQVR